MICQLVISQLLCTYYILATTVSDLNVQYLQLYMPNNSIICNKAMFVLDYGPISMKF